MEAMQDRRAVLAGAFTSGAAAATQAQAQASPAPQAELFVILYRAGPTWRQGRPMQEQDLAAHARYMRSLADSGALLMAGPLTTLDGGLVVVQAKDLAAARAMMQADPAVTGKIFTGEVSAWRPAFDPGKRFGA